MKPSGAFAEFKLRASHLGRRLWARFVNPGPPPVSVSVKGASVFERCVAAMGLYQPAHYPGPLTLFCAEANAHFAADPSKLWRRYCESVESISVPGTHLGSVRTKDSVLRLARGLDACLAKAGVTIGEPFPRALLVTAFRWLTTARIGLAFSDAGFAVETLCRRGHPIARMPFVSASYDYRIFQPMQSMRAAIAASRPHLLVPCDDRVAAQLHELYLHCGTDDPLRSLIARSLGNPQNYHLLYSRFGMAQLAEELAVPYTKTEAIAGKTELNSVLGTLGLPAVLKSDGSWGGRGVAIVSNEIEAAKAFNRLSSPPGLARSLKRLVVEGDPVLLGQCLRRRRGKVSLQRFIKGRLGNAAVACWKGKVLAAVMVEVLKTDGETGPATVVRVTPHEGMSLAISRIVGRLELSGLCGFDFVLSPDGQRAHMIELNPRATPTCHLLAADGTDLATALCAELGFGVDRTTQEAPHLEPVALFPHEMVRDPSSPFLLSAFHDIPSQCPQLVELGFKVRRKRPRHSAAIADSLAELAARMKMIGAKKSDGSD
jgi:hypothetical protein